MQIKNFKNYVNGSKLELRCIYNDQSDQIVSTGITDVLLSGEVSINGISMPPGRYSFDPSLELAFDIMSGSGLVILGMVYQPEEVEQQLSLPDPVQDDEKDYRHIVAIFEKWAHTRGITDSIKPVENVDISDIEGLDDDEFDMNMPLDDYGLLEEDIFPDPDGSIATAITEELAGQEALQGTMDVPSDEAPPPQTDEPEANI